MSNAALEVDELELGYDGPSVVRGVTFTISPGEMTALLGPNGAGKSTTLLGLAGVLPFRSGAVRLGGRPLPSRRPHRVARMGFRLVPDSRGLFARLSVQENLEVAGLNAARCERVFEYFPRLRERLKVRAGALSGGEQRMLSLGRAIASGPEVLAVDEMSMGLAPILVADMLATLRRFCDQERAAVLIVEQFVDAALGVCDRALVLNHGELVLDGAAAELAANRHLIEAAYLGLKA